MSTTPAPTSSTVANPSEVGWQFVPQYYTFVNKHPNRLHCFYTKASTFIHGTEGEESVSCHGQQEIHNKITSIGFQDCKVFIDCVDAQASANGGIVVQVIGEMSNRGEPWRKFVQTFFLAEQPGGYFVLNDIFRFLKEEAVDDDLAAEHAEPEDSPAVSSAQPSAPALDAASPVPPATSEPSPAPESEPELASEEPEPASLEPRIPTPAPEPHVNGVAESSHELESEPAQAEPTPAEATLEPEEEDASETALAAPEAAAPSPTPSPAPPAPQAQAPAATQPQQQPTPAVTPAATPAPPAAPTPQAPAVPKTWANLAATNSKKWGAAVATESRGTSEAPPPVPTPQRQPQTPTMGAGRGLPPPRGDKESHPLYIAAQALTTPQCFVKGVIEPVSQNQLTQVVTQRFGVIKELEIVRNKACAFLEFTTLEAAKRAITASLPIPAGGEGGIRIDCGDGIQARIFVETRKERGERPVSRPRGGAPINGDMRGGFRGRGAPRGRGGPPPPAAAPAPAK